MRKPSNGRPSERKHSFARLAATIPVVVLALAGAIFLANSARTHVTPVVSYVTPATETDSATLVSLTSDNSRPVYPYSIIGGGANSAEDLKRAIDADPVVAAHYADFDLAKTKVVRLTQPKFAHVSYRIGNSVYWTRKPLVIPAGETVLSDGTHMARTRCANQMEEADGAEAPGPMSPREPAAAVMDAPLSSPGSPVRQTVPSSARPSALAGPSGLAGQTAASTGAGSGFGGSGGAKPAAEKKSSSASPMAAGSLGALGLYADQAADPAAEVPQLKDTLARPQISAGPSGTPALLAEGPSSNPFHLPASPGSIPALPPTGASVAAGGPSAGPPNNAPGQPPNTPPGTPDTVVSTAGKDPTSDPVQSADVTTPPNQDDPNQGPATIPEPGTTLLLIGAATAYAARRFRKGPAPRV